MESRQKTSIGFDTPLPDESLLLRRTWTRFPQEKGLCFECKMQFMAMSCYDDGKHYYCPVCSNLLDFEVELPKKSDVNSEVELPKKSDVSSEVELSKKSDESPASAAIENTCDKSDLESKDADGGKGIDSSLTNNDEAGSIVESVVSQGKDGGVRREENVSESNENSNNIDSPPEVKPLPQKNVNRSLLRGKTEIDRRKFDDSKTMRKFDRSNTMVAGGSKPYSKKTLNKTVSSPFLKVHMSELKMILRKEFLCRRHKGCVNSITPVTTEKAWMVIQNSAVALYNRNGNLLQSITKHRRTVTDACIDENGNIYLACFNDKCIMRISKTGGLSKFTGTYGIFPAELALTTQRELVVVGVGRKDAVTYDEDEEYGVLIFGSDGQLITKITALSEPFRYPIYVDVSVHGEIAVGDYINKEVVLLTISGSELLRFNGSEIFAHSFVPKGLCFDRLGNVIVANWDGALCILERDKQFAPRGLLLSDGFEPLSIAVDEKNDLWIGGRNGAVVRVYSFE